MTPMLAMPGGLPSPAPGEKVYMTRFAPSPSGFLHLGHAYAALFAHEAARLSRGRFRLRIEDIDVTRSRPNFERAIFEDLQWLGLRLVDKPLRQSERMHEYRKALDRLARKGVVYPCFCTRKQIREEIAAADSAPHGPTGETLYPGHCRDLPEREAKQHMAAGAPYAMRLNVEKALEITGPLRWLDLRKGWIEADPASLGDVVLGRKDVAGSYHLSVVIDDAAQHVTLVTRGEDLFHATHVHVLLQALLGLEQPRWAHHDLIANADGRRMAKRDQAVTIRHMRESGVDPVEIWRMFGFAEPPRRLLAARATA